MATNGKFRALMAQVGGQMSSDRVIKDICAAVLAVGVLAGPAMAQSQPAEGFFGGLFQSQPSAADLERARMERMQQDPQYHDAVRMLQRIQSLRQGQDVEEKPRSKAVLGSVLGAVAGRVVGSVAMKGEHAARNANLLGLGGAAAGAYVGSQYTSGGPDTVYGSAVLKGPVKSLPPEWNAKLNDLEVQALQRRVENQKAFRAAEMAKVEMSLATGTPEYAAKQQEFGAAAVVWKRLAAADKDISIAYVNAVESIAMAGRQNGVVYDLTNHVPAYAKLRYPMNSSDQSYGELYRAATIDPTLATKEYGAAAAAAQEREPAQPYRSALSF